MIVVSSRHDDVTEYAQVAEHSKIVKGELSDAHSFHIKYNVDTSADQSEASAKLDPVTRFDVADSPTQLDLYTISFTFTHAPVYRIKDISNSQRNGIAV
jgi:hypothetical protein